MEVPKSVGRPGLIIHTGHMLFIVLKNLPCIPFEVRSQPWVQDEVGSPVPEWAMRHRERPIFTLVRDRNTIKLELDLEKVSD